MSDGIKCPVCGKVGIPNYHDEDIICPCCGSDLSIFRIVDQIPNTEGPKKNVWKPIATVAILAAVVLGASLIIKPTATNVKDADENRLETQIACLHDSINHLNDQLQIIAQSDKRNIDGSFKYVVRKGDSFWSISKRFYHTGTRYEDVAAANGLDCNSMLNVGDTIIIKQ